MSVVADPRAAQGASAAGREPRQPEVEQLGAVRFVNITLPGFRSRWTIPPRCAAVERVGDLNRRLQRGLLGERERAPRQSRQVDRQRLAVQVLHDEKLVLAMPADVVERADVRMSEAGDRARLAFEALAHVVAPVKRRGQDLDGDDAVEAGITGAIHLPHAAGPERRDDFVRAEPCSWSESHGRGSFYSRKMGAFRLGSAGATSIVRTSAAPRAAGRGEARKHAARRRRSSSRPRASR